MYVCVCYYACSTKEIFLQDFLEIIFFENRENYLFQWKINSFHDFLKQEMFSHYFEYEEGPRWQ